MPPHKSINNFIKTGYTELELPLPTTESLPIKLTDGINAFLPSNHNQGRKYILVDEWGPYNFQYPTIWLRTREEGNYTFIIFGPHGNWKVVGGTGFSSLSLKTGTMPATLVAKVDSTAQNHAIELEFIGEAFTTQFGEYHEKGKVFEFNWTDDN